jgi:hypothetical protein
MADDPWEVKVNAQYQDNMKTMLSLATASLGIPLVLVKDFLELPKGGPPGIFLNGWAYTSSGLLCASILLGMVFFYASDKYAKALYKRSLTQVSVGPPMRAGGAFETTRDTTIVLSAACFLGGLGCLLVFFRTLLVAKT